MPEMKYRAGAFKATVKELADVEVTLKPSGADPSLLSVSGKCPRCKHPIHREIPERVYEVTGDGSTATATVGTSAVTTETITVGEPAIIHAIRDYVERHPRPDIPEKELVLECDCGHTHADGKTGCGAIWSMHLEWDETKTTPVDAKLTPGVDVTALEIDAERQRDALGRTELTRLRAAAGNWRTGLAALLALLPTLVVVKGNDAVKDLSNGYKLLIGVLTALGALAAIIAAVLALRAAFGPLKREQWRADMDALRRDETDTTISDLKWTRKLTLASLLLLGAAIGIAWSAPSSDPAFFEVTQKNGHVVCGKYGGVDLNAMKLKVKRTDETILLADVKKAAFVTSC
jgi:hypothetical protein